MDGGEIAQRVNYLLFGHKDRSSDPVYPHKSKQHAPIIPVWGERDRRPLEGHRHCLSNQTGKLQVQWEALYQKTTWRVTEDLQCWLLAPQGHICAHTYTCMCTPCMCICVHTWWVNGWEYMEKHWDCAQKMIRSCRGKGLNKEAFLAAGLALTARSGWRGSLHAHSANRLFFMLRCVHLNT